MFKKIMFHLILILLLSGVLITGAEIMIMLLFPQEYMYPRWEFSKEYGSMLYKNTVMTHTVPGRWKYNYTVNEYAYRGRPVKPDGPYDKKNIIVLGDSYSFGTGVPDGREYPAIMDAELRDGYNVINLSVGGWGLAQEIRRFYEFGMRYEPSIVVLQFCANDPDDNFQNMVAVVRDGKFVFQDSNNKANNVKKYLSRSWIQMSQLYALVRNRLYQMTVKHIKDSARKDFVSDGITGPEQVSADEKMYIDLLTLFAEDLSKRGIRLVMISVNGQLDDFPGIKQAVFGLEKKGRLVYCDIATWFDGEKDYGAPDGHIWGEKAHKIIGDKLSDYIKNLDNKRNF